MPDVPLLGNVPKGALFAGGLAVVGVGGYLLYKHMTKPKVVTPPAGAAGYGMAAGYGYGNAYSYGGAYGYGLGGGGLPPYGYGVGQPPLPPTPTSNAAWAQNVTTQLTAQGYAGTDILSALGAYLTGNAVQQGSTQDQIIQAAIAIGGYPPIPGASGFPPAVKYGGQNPGQGGTVNVTASARYDNVTGSWQKVSGATSYDVTLTTHQGSQTVQTTSTAGTSVTFHGLPQKTSFAVHVTAQPGGQTGVAYTTTR